MTRRIYVPLLVVAVLALAIDAHAQATRTWVSGVGDDANPCSRTAPCKTFAGAISKTAAGGEISVLDPGGFGAVTITKSITINGRAQISSILGSGTTGVVVNAAATDIVTLKDLDINGGGTGLRGVRYMAGKQLNIERCTIWNSRGAPGRGVDVNGSGAVTMNLHISDSTIFANAGSGIAIAPVSGTPTVNAHIVRTIIKQNENGAPATSGIFAGEGSRVVVTDSYIAGHTTLGVDAGGVTSPAVVAIDNTSLVNNGMGVQTSGGATIRIMRSLIANNATRGFNILGGSILSSGDNRFINNGPNVGVLGSVPLQ